MRVLHRARRSCSSALRRLLAEREQGRAFQRVAIETRSDLGPILRTFATERALGGEFYVEEEPTAVADGNAFHADARTRRSSWDAFSRFIATLTALRGADLLHLKGLLNVAGCRGPVAVQFVQHLALRPVELQAWPDDGSREPAATFITRDVDEQRRCAACSTPCAHSPRRNTPRRSHEWSAR